MMTYEIFRSWLFGRITEAFPKVEISKMDDWHNFEVVALKLEGGNSGLAPIISPTEWYESYKEGESLEAIERQLLKRIESDNLEDMTVRILDSVWTLKHVKVEVVKRDWNKTMLEKMIYREIDGTDLVYVPVIKVKKDGKTLTGRFTEELIMLYKMSVDEFIDVAIRNTLADDVNLSTVLDGIYKVDPGAGAFMPEVLDVIYGKEHHGVYIFPFEINRVMLVPAELVDSKVAKLAFAESRHNLEIFGLLEKEDEISDKVYLYKDGKMSIL